MLPVGGWEGCVTQVAEGSESSGSRTKTWFMGLDLPQGSARSPALVGDSTQQGHSSAPGLLSGSHCTQLLAPGLLPSLPHPLTKSCHAGRWASILFSSPISMVSTGTWTLTELSEVLKVPVTSLKRKMTLWLQQGVLREEPQGTFTVIEEEQKDQVEKVVLIDSDEEGDSAMASQADQKEEELQVSVCLSLLLVKPAGRCKHPMLLVLGNLIKMMDSICILYLHFPLQGAKSSMRVF